MKIYEEVKRALQDIVAPELKALQVEIKRIDEKIDSNHKSLDQKIDSLREHLRLQPERRTKVHGSPASVDSP